MRARAASASLVLMLAAALAAGFAGAGCGTPSNPQASKLIKEANAHLENAADQVKGIGDFNQQFAALFTGAPNPQAATKVRELLEGARKKEQKALDETKEARDTLSKVKELQISDNMKEYIDLKLSALDEQEQALTIELQAMDLRIATIKRVEQGATFEELVPQEKQINDLEQQWAEHMARAADFNKQAKDFYQEKKLGG